MTHDGHQSSDRPRATRRLAFALPLLAGYMLAEIVGGLVTNSLALLADAGHMLSDVGALGLALFAAWVARRPADSARTFGYLRAEILAALVNAAGLFVVAVLVLVEAWRRLASPPEVQGLGMLLIATGGLGVNLVGLWLLSDARGESLNARGAWLHMLGDALGSVGAMASGLLVWALGWRWADPVASALISALIIFSGWGLLRESVSVLMESVPGGIDLDEVRGELRAIVGVAAVHDLHVWSIASDMVSLSCHLTSDGTRPARDVLADARSRLAGHFGIEHVTIQVEEQDFVQLGAARARKTDRREED